ncbi:hypothetical protein OG21DRAFT_1604322 [Imleria badia]|nr:hypothetical protein OG21DRAFT_1604322 [Imleria badia]
MFNMLVLIFYIPLLYQAVYHHSSIRSAVDMLPFILSSATTTTSSALILWHTGHYWGILVGALLYLWLFFSVTENTSSTKLIIYQVLYGTTAQNTFIALQAHSEAETVSVCNAVATVMQMLGDFIRMTMYTRKILSHARGMDWLKTHSSSAGVVFDAQLRTNLAVYAPNVDPGPITASVAAIYSAVIYSAAIYSAAIYSAAIYSAAIYSAAIYSTTICSAVSSTERPTGSVIHAYVKSGGSVPAGFLTIFGAALIRNVNLGANDVPRDLDRRHESTPPPREDSEKN